MSSVLEIMRLTPEQRKQVYQANGIDKVFVDAEEYTNYGSFTFSWEKSYVKSPLRSGDGSIENLDSYTTFVVPHLKIHFDLISIDDYRRLIKQMLSKNEFTVKCYDIIYNKIRTLKMYFPPEELPKLFAITEKVQGSTSVNLIGVLDYTIELIGTKSFDKIEE